MQPSAVELGVAAIAGGYELVAAEPSVPLGLGASSMTTISPIALSRLRSPRQLAALMLDLDRRAERRH